MGREEQLSKGMLYGQGAAVSTAGKERLSKDIVDHQEDRKKLSRRRMTAERYILFHDWLHCAIYLLVSFMKFFAVFIKFGPFFMEGSLTVPYMLSNYLTVNQLLSAAYSIQTAISY